MCLCLCAFVCVCVCIVCVLVTARFCRYTDTHNTHTRAHTRTHTYTHTSPDADTHLQVGGVPHDESNHNKQHDLRVCACGVWVCLWTGVVDELKRCDVFGHHDMTTTTTPTRRTFPMWRITPFFSETSRVDLNTLFETCNKPPSFTTNSRVTSFANWVVWVRVGTCVCVCVCVCVCMRACMSTNPLD